MKKQWRIVTDSYAGYEVQCRSWLWPFWHMPSTNTHHSVARAEDYIRHITFEKVVEPISERKKRAKRYMINGTRCE